MSNIEASKVFGKSGQMMFCLSCICKKENDREINKWYNEEKIVRTD